MPLLWPEILKANQHIFFAYTSFKWSNLAKHNAGVTVVIVGLAKEMRAKKRLFELNFLNEISVHEVNNINPYLIASKNVEVTSSPKPISQRGTMQFGNHPYYGADLIFSSLEADRIKA